MKYLPILFVLLTCLCVDLPFDIPINFPTGPNVLVQGDPYLQLNVQVIPQEITEERDITLIFELKNNNNYDIRDVSVRAYDTCIFTGDDYDYIPNEGKADEGILKSNQSKSWKWVWTAGSTRLEKDCNIKISAEYSADFSLSQDIVVLSEDEYSARQMEGTLYTISAQSYSSKSPLDIRLSFPEKQPFVEKINNYGMEIEYYNVGDCFLTVYDSDIVITEPDNINIVECVGGSVSDDKLIFINKKSSKRTCYFNTVDIDQPISIQKLQITADYTYLIDTSVSVKVIPTKTSTD